MLPLDAERAADAVPDPAFSEGSTMGKRYVDDGDAEVLVTKAGAGSLSVGATPLALAASTAGNSGNWLSVPATATAGTAFPVSVNPAIETNSAAPTGASRRQTSVDDHRSPGL